MNTLRRQSDMLPKHVSTKHIRNLYHDISWGTRLVGIKGARGVGKTTMMLQRMKLAFEDTHTISMRRSANVTSFRPHLAKMHTRAPNA